MKLLNKMMVVFTSSILVLTNASPVLANGRYNNSQRAVKIEYSSETKAFALYDCGSAEGSLVERDCRIVMNGNSQMPQEIVKHLNAKSESIKTPTYYAVEIGATVATVVCVVGLGVCVWAPLLTFGEMLSIGRAGAEAYVVLGALTAATPTLIYFAKEYEEKLSMIKDSIKTITAAVDTLQSTDQPATMVVLDSAALNVLREFPKYEHQNLVTP